MASLPVPWNDSCDHWNPAARSKIDKAIFKRSYGEPNIWHKDLVISLAESSILYQGFRYPLHRIRGRIEALDDQWRLVGFEAGTIVGRIQCNGGWQELRNTNIPFNLVFTAHTLPMKKNCSAPCQTTPDRSGINCSPAAASTARM